MKYIAFDLDNTIDKHSSIWIDLMNDMIQLTKWRPIVVTCRERTAENVETVKEFLGDQGFPVGIEACYFTNRQAKKPYMEALGLNVIIWIDDDPACIIHGK